jgi:predicted metal-dependent HD superfamily phosphohydrolase
MFSRSHFNASLGTIGIVPKIEVFDELAEAYGQVGRYYHTDRHISECLRQFKGFSHLAKRPGEIEIALWFHDAVYDSRRQDNEALSAEWATQYLNSEGVESGVGVGEASPMANRISAMILATKTHVALDADTALLLDIDLGILGSSPEAFEAYDRAIRLEYAWVPELEYRSARAKVLQQFLDRPILYQTLELRDRYEAQARSNLERKILNLNAIHVEPTN